MCSPLDNNFNKVNKEFSVNHFNVVTPYVFMDSYYVITTTTMARVTESCDTTIFGGGCHRMVEDKDDNPNLLHLYLVCVTGRMPVHR